MLVQHSLLIKAHKKLLRDSVNNWQFLSPFPLSSSSSSSQLLGLHTSWTSNLFSFQPLSGALMWSPCMCVCSLPQLSDPNTSALSIWQTGGGLAHSASKEPCRSVPHLILTSYIYSKEDTTMFCSRAFRSAEPVLCKPGKPSGSCDLGRVIVHSHIRILHLQPTHLLPVRATLIHRTCEHFKQCPL